MHQKVLVCSAENIYTVFFEYMDYFFHSVSAMIVWRYELVLHVVVCDCLFEVCGTFIVENVDRRRLVLFP